MREPRTVVRSYFQALSTINVSNVFSQNGIYQAYLSGTTHPSHPFCDWLVNQHAVTYAADLDIQMKLERNQQPDIGTIRIQHIRDHLLTRL